MKQENQIAIKKCGRTLGKFKESINGIKIKDVTEINSIAVTLRKCFVICGINKNNYPDGDLGKVLIEFIIV